jgi:SAM-dependent methyltransferase
MPLTDEFIFNIHKKEYLANIEIGICEDCNVVQNLNNTNMDKYYNDYVYSVGSSSFALQFMEDLASIIKEIYFPIQKNICVLEIGSGSGEQLNAFKNLGFDVIGIEPSNDLSDYANKNNIQTICDFFSPVILNVLPEKFKQVDCIISSYTFDHIPYLNETFDACKALLNANGVLIVEIHDLDLIMERKEFCLFEHEHYYYLNRYSAIEIFWKNGFEILTFDLLNESKKRANSLLIVAKKITNESKKISIDKAEYLNKIVYLQSNIQKTITKIDDWLFENKDKSIVAYGAGGRGVMTLAGLKNYSYFSYVVDQNPKGETIYTPKTHLSVYKPDKLSSENIDLIFIFSFGYTNEIIENLSLYGYKKSQFISLLDFM